MQYACLINIYVCSMYILCYIPFILSRPSNVHCKHELRYLSSWFIVFLLSRNLALYVHYYRFNWVAIVDYAHFSCCYTAYIYLKSFNFLLFMISFWIFKNTQISLIIESLPSCNINTSSLPNFWIAACLRCTCVSKLTGINYDCNLKLSSKWGKTFLYDIPQA